MTIGEFEQGTPSKANRSLSIDIRTTRSKLTWEVEELGETRNLNKVMKLRKRKNSK